MGHAKEDHFNSSKKPYSRNACQRYRKGRKDCQFARMKEKLDSSTQQRRKPCQLCAEGRFTSSMADLAAAPLSGLSDFFREEMCKEQSPHCDNTTKHALEPSVINE